MSQLEEAASGEFTEVNDFAQRESVSEAIVLIPSIQDYEYCRLPESTRPVVTFLDSPVEGTNQPEPEETDVVAKSLELHHPLQVPLIVLLVSSLLPQVQLPSSLMELKVKVSKSAYSLRFRPTVIRKTGS